MFQALWVKANRRLRYFKMTKLLCRKLTISKLSNISTFKERTNSLNSRGSVNLSISLSSCSNLKKIKWGHSIKSWNNTNRICGKISLKKGPNRTHQLSITPQQLWLSRARLGDLIRMPDVQRWDLARSRASFFKISHHQRQRLVTGLIQENKTTR